MCAQASIAQLGDDARDKDNRRQYYATQDAEHDAFLESLRDAELDAKLPIGIAIRQLGYNAEDSPDGLWVMLRETEADV